MGGREGMQLSCTPHFKGSKIQHSSSQANCKIWDRSTDLLKTLIHRWEKCQTKFPRCKMNAKLCSKEKRQGFHNKKSKLNVIWRNIMCNQNKLVGEVRHTDNCSFVSLFTCTLKLLAQIALMFSVKYFCISWSPKRWAKTVKTLDQGIATSEISDGSATINPIL